ncbi:hypothetical protein KIN20_031664 [Parelaphostrongylus tenuis]|uniref:Uncharacterized protein n=1 Tax=Parelaphostrongylus tenuis TaxID=148309 RepID=A0AAD5R5F0_PARTN|nr:hypothetical protein KIN20_031664 [Parelaphostrongylus tenuis]
MFPALTVQENGLGEDAVSSGNGHVAVPESSLHRPSFIRRSRSSPVRDMKITHEDGGLGSKVGYPLDFFLNGIRVAKIVFVVILLN